MISGSLLLNQESVDSDECDEGVNGDIVRGPAQFADSLPPCIALLTRSLATINGCIDTAI
jgi:hypothetical protein